MPDCSTSTLRARHRRAERRYLQHHRWNVEHQRVPQQDHGAARRRLHELRVPHRCTLVEASSPTSAGNLDYVLRMMTQTAPRPPATTNSERCWNVPSQVHRRAVPPVPLRQQREPGRGRRVHRTAQLQRARPAVAGRVRGRSIRPPPPCRAAAACARAQAEGIRISGGVCNSDPWVQMFADVLNLPVETVAVTELGGLGGAMCAAVGSACTGRSRSVRQHVEARQAVRAARGPDRGVRRKFEAYEALLTALDGGWAALRDMQNSLER